MTSVSVVIAARDEPRLDRTVAGLCRELPERGEIVVVDDASREPVSAALGLADPRVHVWRPATRLGVAAARNAGARRSTGALLLFTDAHVDVREGWPALLDHLADPRVGAVGPTLLDTSEAAGRGLRFCDSETNIDWLDERGSAPYPVPILPGFFIAMRRDVFVELGGFDEGMVGWGMDDVEFSMHLVTLGYACLVVPEIEVVHAPVVAEPDYHLEWASALQNILRFGHVHLGERRLHALHDAYREHDAFARALAAVHAGDAERRRIAVQSARRHDDDWFFGLCGLG